jgi:hypothetical protein
MSRPAQLTAAARIQDLEHLQREFARLNRSLTAQTGVVFEGRLASLRERAGTLTHGSFVMGIAHAVASADDGHTDVLALEHFQRLPLRFAWFTEGLHITSSAPAYAQLLGARVEHIAGSAPQDILRALRDYIPGHEHRVLNWSTAYMSAPAALEGIGLTRDASELTIGVRGRDGSASEHAIAGQTWGGEHVRNREWRNLVPNTRPDGVRTAWRHVLDGHGAVPEYLQHPDRLYCHSWEPARNLLYVRVSTTNHEGPTRLDDYLKSVLEQAAARRPQTIVVDLRFNTGGMFSLIYFFCVGLPKVLADGGRIFVITGRSTFSAGICMTAFLRYFGEGRTTIVGERVADRDAFWAEGDFVVLPNSGVTATYVDGFFDVVSDRPRYESHYWMNVAYGVPAGSLEPDIPVQLTFADYLVGVDPCMQRILTEI